MEKRRKKKVKKVHRVGIGLAKLQVVCSVLLLAVLYYSRLFPAEYMKAAAVVLAVLCVTVFYTQRSGRGHAVYGKLLSLVLIVVISFGTFYVGKVNAAFKKISSGISAEADVEKPFSVYISGIDEYGELKKESRSDVNIVATVNPETHQILLVTTPRDYFVEIPGVTDGQKDKLTHAGTYGVDASMNALAKLYDTEIPFYARVNFTSLIEIVDELGGVDVESECEFDTGIESGKEIHVVKGMNHFDGQEALAFARERHNLADGDNQRGKNQQAVLTALIKKVVTPEILIKANTIIDRVSSNVEMNFSQKQLKAIVRNQLHEMKGWDIVSVAAEGTSVRDYCYSIKEKTVYVMIPNEDSVVNIQEMIKRVKNGEILEGSEIAE